MKRAFKLLLLAITLVPLVELLIFLGSFFLSLLSPSQGEFDLSESFALQLFNIAWVVAMTAYYVANVLRSRQLSKNWKFFWVVILILTNMYSMPIYWYLYIWRDNAKS